MIAAPEWLSWVQAGLACGIGGLVLLLVGVWARARRALHSQRRRRTRNRQQGR